ncbi:MAG: hypothetical protein E3K32_13905 [wastewater metagenome]|nr:hypothetical protein [Candidatus Loosdrechtia aerotolerans]
MGYNSPKGGLIKRYLSGFKSFRLSAFMVIMIATLSPAMICAGDNDECLDCHTNPEKLKVTEKTEIDPITGEIEVIPLVIDEAAFKKSAHGGEDFYCVDCHSELEDADLSEGHKPNLKPVDCITFCHDDPAEEFLKSSHVKLMKEKNKDVPTCKDCHTGVRYEDSGIVVKSPMNVPRADDPSHRRFTIESCGSCHEDYFSSYRNNAHGQVTALGHTTTDVPVCFDCHGKHTILNSSDPESKVGKEKILETCGECHANAHESFVMHVEHPQIKNIGYYRNLLAAIKNARNDPENLKNMLKNPQTILCVVFVMYIGILAFTFSSFGLHSLLTWFATVRDECGRKGHDEEHH